MLRITLLVATAFVAYRALQENLPRIPHDFDLPGGAPPSDRTTGSGSGRTR